MPSTNRKRRRIAFRPKSKDYMLGFFDAIDRLSMLAYHGPIFLQVLATLAGKDILIPGVDKYDRAEVLKMSKTLKGDIKSDSTKRTGTTVRPREGKQ